MTPNARAPYNFIPLAEGDPIEGDYVIVDDRKRPIPHDCYNPERHTGYFDVQMKTETPLFVRGMLTAEEFAQDKQAKDQPMPFILNGRAVIPGSSLRGMIRSLVEIITFGKMHFISDANKIFFRAVAAKKDDPQGQAYKTILGRPNLNVHAGEHVRVGYLVYRDRQWYVQPAKGFGQDRPFALVPDRREVVEKVKGIRHLSTGNYRINIFDVCYKLGTNGKASEVYTPSDPAEATATLVCTGNMAETQGSSEHVRTNRKNFVLVLKETQGKPLLIREDVVEAYLDSLSPFQAADNEQSKHYFDAQKGMLQAGRPVFYIEEGGEVIHFGHNPNFRVAHTRTDSKGRKYAITPRDRVPKPLLQADFIDFAEAMFGYVSEQREQRTPTAYAGRVSVTSATCTQPIDAVLHAKDDMLKRTPGSPKPTTFQHYLEQPSGTATRKPDLHHYGITKAKVRGHKLYWRQKTSIQYLKNRNSDGSKPKIETQFRPIMSGAEFAFRVHFENLSTVELGALAWALTLDGVAEGHHQLGMGKPYGLGAVKLTPTLVLSDREARYQRLFDDDGHWHRAETTVDMDTPIQAFKNFIHQQTGRDFESHPRIQELMTMLALREPDDRKFAYMDDLKDYVDRPVLPRPREVVKENKG